MRLKLKTEGFVDVPGIKIITNWQQVEFAGDTPKSTLVSIQYLKECLEIAEKMELSEVFVTVMGDGQPIGISEKRYKGGVIFLAPREEED